MIRIAPYIGCLAATIALVSCATSRQTVPASPAMSFQIDEGRNINSFVREGAVAAHLLLRSGTDPRILVAFPAGNSGVGLWFAKSAQPVVWALTRPPTPATDTDAQGRKLHGIEAEVTVDISKLDIHQAVLSSVRVLRDYQRSALFREMSRPLQLSQAIASPGRGRGSMAHPAITCRSKDSMGRKSRRMPLRAAPMVRCD